MANPEIPGRKFVRYQELRSDYGIPFTRVHIKRLEDQGLFPQRVHPGDNGAVSWFSNELADYMEAKAAARDVVSTTAPAAANVETSTSDIAPIAPDRKGIGHRDASPPHARLARAPKTTPITASK